MQTQALGWAWRCRSRWRLMGKQALMMVWALQVPSQPWVSQHRQGRQQAQTKPQQVAFARAPRRALKVWFQNEAKRPKLPR